MAAKGRREVAEAQQWRCWEWARSRIWRRAGKIGCQRRARRGGECCAPVDLCLRLPPGASPNDLDQYLAPFKRCGFGYGASALLGLGCMHADKEPFDHSGKRPSLHRSLKTMLLTSFLGPSLHAPLLAEFWLVMRIAPVCTLFSPQSSPPPPTRVLRCVPPLLGSANGRARRVQILPVWLERGWRETDRFVHRRHRYSLGRRFVIFLWNFIEPQMVCMYHAHTREILGAEAAPKF